MNNETELNKTTSKALSLFNSGFNCSQSVLSAFAKSLNLDNKIATGIACGFGAGMGRMQETCGAVTGAYMVLGLYCGNKYEDNAERKEKSYLMIQAFKRKFEQKHKTSNCLLLLNCDVNTEAGQEQFHTDNLFEEVCENCIKDAVQYLYEQIEN